MRFSWMLYSEFVIFFKLIGRVILCSFRNYSTKTTLNLWQVLLKKLQLKKIGINSSGVLG